MIYLHHATMRNMWKKVHFLQNCAESLLSRVSYRKREVKNTQEILHRARVQRSYVQTKYSLAKKSKGARLFMGIFSQTEGFLGKNMRNLWRITVYRIVSYFSKTQRGDKCKRKYITFMSYTSRYSRQLAQQVSGQSIYQTGIYKNPSQNNCNFTNLLINPRLI